MKISEKINFQNVESQFLETQKSLQKKFREIDRSVLSYRFDEKNPTFL